LHLFSLSFQTATPTIYWHFSQSKRQHDTRVIVWPDLLIIRFG
jgi:hypothetical protein